MARGLQHHLHVLARHRDIGAEGARGQPVAHHVHQRVVARDIGGEFRHIVHGGPSLGGKCSVACKRMLGSKRFALY